MDNQHKLIAGYRDLTQAEIDLINEWKRLEMLLDTQLSQLDARGTAQARWNAMARTHLETGVMYAIKALAYPKGGLGNPAGEGEREPAGRPASQAGALTGSRQNETPPERDLEHEGAVRAQQAVYAAEAKAKERERRVHEDRQRHGFDPYAAPRRAATPRERQAEEDEAAEELRSIEEEEIRRELDAEEEGFHS